MKSHLWLYEMSRQIFWIPGRVFKVLFSIEVESLFSNVFFWQFDGCTSIEQSITACFWPISIAWMVALANVVVELVWVLQKLLACELAFRLINRQIIKVNVVLIIHGVVKWSSAHPYWTACIANCIIFFLSWASFKNVLIHPVLASHRQVVFTVK